jgi:hypothetical protein
MECFLTSGYCLELKNTDSVLVSKSEILSVINRERPTAIQEG